MLCLILLLQPLWSFTQYKEIIVCFYSKTSDLYFGFSHLCEISKEECKLTFKVRKAITHLALRIHNLSSYILLDVAIYHLILKAYLSFLCWYHLAKELERDNTLTIEVFDSPLTNDAYFLYCFQTISSLMGFWGFGVLGVDPTLLKTYYSSLERKK